MTKEQEREELHRTFGKLQTIYEAVLTVGILNPMY